MYELKLRSSIHVYANTVDQDNSIDWVVHEFKPLFVKISSIFEDVLIVDQDLYTI